MSRSSDPEGLIPFLEAREAFAFGYSGAANTHDCARFCDAGVMAVTGQSPLKALSASWSSEIGAARVLSRMGGMAAAVDTVMTRIDPCRANRGDVGLLDDRTLVLVEGACVVGPAPVRGLFRRPRAAMIAAWTVRQ